MSVPEKIIDKELYKKVRNEIKKDYPKHSAYRSMLIIKEYKNKGGKINEELEKNSELNRWKMEKWKNLSCIANDTCDYPKNNKEWEQLSACGKKYLKQKDKTICRPIKKINSDTPSLAQTYNEKQIKKAQKIKNKGKRIDWNNL